MEHKLSIDTNFVTIGHIIAEILRPTLYYSLCPEQNIPHIPDISVGQRRLLLKPCTAHRLLEWPENTQWPENAGKRRKTPENTKILPENTTIWDRISVCIRWGKGGTEGMVEVGGGTVG